MTALWAVVLLFGGFCLGLFVAALMTMASDWERKERDSKTGR